MAIHYRCPKCQTTDSAGDELAGTQIRCRQCGALLQLPGARPSHHVTESPGVPPPAPPPLPASAEPPTARRRNEEDDYDDPPRRRDREDEFGLSHGEPPAGWTAASTGLGMMFWTLLALVIEAVVFGIALAATGVAFAGPGQFRPQRDDSMAVLAVAGGCAFLVTVLVYFVGQCLCCAVPSHSGARGFALGSVICTVLIVVLYLVFFLVVAGMAQGGNPMFFMAGRIEGPVIAFLLLIFGLGHTAHILFIVFLKAVARYFGDEGLRRGANGYLIMYIVLASIHAVVLVLQFTLMARPGLAPGAQNLAPLFMVVGCILGVIGLAAFVWYLVLLAQTRGAIRRSLAKPGY